MDDVLTICEDVILLRNVLGAATVAADDQLIPTGSLSAYFSHGWGILIFFPTILFDFVGFYLVPVSFDSLGFFFRNFFTLFEFPYLFLPSDT